MAEQDLDNDYDGAGYNKRLGFGERPALILIDYVEAYFDKSSPLYAGVDDALASGIRIRDAARRSRVPVIYTNVVYTKGGVNGGMFIKKVPTLHIMEQGGPMGAWPKGLEPSDADVQRYQHVLHQQMTHRARDPTPTPPGPGGMQSRGTLPPGSHKLQGR